MTTPNKNALSELREQFLSRQDMAEVKPSQELPRLWGLMMEIGYPKGSISILAFQDGTTSFYTFPNQSGVIGLGSHVSVRAASHAFLVTGEFAFEHFKKAEDHNFPAAGQVKFYAMTYDGTLSCVSGEGELAGGFGALSSLYGAGQAVITQVRMTSQRLEAEKTARA